MRDWHKYFVGTWQLSRALVDYRTRHFGRLSGQAVISGPEESAAEARYHEDGLLRFGPYRGVSFRDYRFTFAGLHLTVRFADGRDFFSTDLAEGAGKFIHHCGQDIYSGLLTILSDDRWQWAWRIEGPKKDMIMRSQFHRLILS